MILISFFHNTYMSKRYSIKMLLVLTCLFFSLNISAQEDLQVSPIQKKSSFNIGAETGLNHIPSNPYQSNNQGIQYGISFDYTIYNSSIKIKFKQFSVAKSELFNSTDTSYYNANSSVFPLLLSKKFRYEQMTVYIQGGVYYSYESNIRYSNLFDRLVFRNDIGTTWGLGFEFPLPYNNITFFTEAEYYKGISMKNPMDIGNFFNYIFTYQYYKKNLENYNISIGLKYKL
jgi:hypothetical protein